MPACAGCAGTSHQDVCTKCAFFSTFVYALEHLSGPDAGLHSATAIRPRRSWARSEGVPRAHASSQPRCPRTGRGWRPSAVPSGTCARLPGSRQPAPVVHHYQHDDDRYELDSRLRGPIAEQPGCNSAEQGFPRLPFTAPSRWRSCPHAVCDVLDRLVLCARPEQYTAARSLESVSE